MLGENSKVDMLKRPLGCWNKELVHDFFMVEDADAILGIPSAAWTLVTYWCGITRILVSTQSEVVIGWHNLPLRILVVRV